MTDEFSNCPNPWCHSHSCTVEPCASLDKPIIKSPHLGTYYIACGSCCVQGPRLATKGEAIAAWNTRAAQPASVKEQSTDRRTYADGYKAGLEAAARLCTDMAVRHLNLWHGNNRYQKVCSDLCTRNAEAIRAFAEQESDDE